MRSQLEQMGREGNEVSLDELDGLSDVVRVSKEMQRVLGGRQLNAKRSKLSLDGGDVVLQSVTLCGEVKKACRSWNTLTNSIIWSRGVMLGGRKRLTGWGVFIALAASIFAQEVGDTKLRLIGHDTKCGLIHRFGRNNRQGDGQMQRQRDGITSPWGASVTKCTCLVNKGFLNYLSGVHVPQPSFRWGNPLV